MSAEIIIIPCFSPDGAMVTLVMYGNTPGPLSRLELAESLRAFADIWEDGEDPESMN